MIRNPRWARYWPTHAILRVATLGSLGSFKAPGTWGSLAGLFLYLVVVQHLSPFLGFLLLMALCYVAIAVCGEAERRLKKVDPPEVVFDEFVAMPICFIGLNDYMQTEKAILYVLIGFALFRLLDILKPFGIRGLQRYYGGFGVVIDDVAAAVASCVVLNALARFVL